MSYRNENNSSRVESEVEKFVLCSVATIRLLMFFGGEGKVQPHSHPIHTAEGHAAMCAGEAIVHQGRETLQTERILRHKQSSILPNILCHELCHEIWIYFPLPIVICI
jgi:hypothetical protein